MRMKSLRPIGLVLTFIVTVIVLQKLAGTGTAPVPEVFGQGLSLDGAIERGRAEKKPVFVFATADWCGPCQQMKRTVLSEASVEKQIARDFVPVYVDLDKNQAAAERLAVLSIPATLVLWEGKPVARMEGLMPHDSYQKWLEAAHAQATSERPYVERASDEFVKKLKAKTDAADTGAEPAGAPPHPDGNPPR